MLNRNFYIENISCYKQTWILLINSFKFTLINKIIKNNKICSVTIKYAHTFLKCGFHSNLIFPLLSAAVLFVLRGATVWNLWSKVNMKKLNSIFGNFLDVFITVCLDKKHKSIKLDAPC